ncbi:MAG: PEP-CTERM sorting domain-containing protein [Acidobacteriota bacterium]
MKRILLGAFALVCIAGTALAAPISLPTGVPLYFQFNNLEQVDTSGLNGIVVPGSYNGTNTQGNWGVMNVSSIQNGAISIDHTNISGGPVFWQDDGPGGTQGQIVGIFYGINLTSGTTASGGILDLFWYNAGSDPVTAACLAGGCGPTAATVAEFTGGTFLARLDFTPGIINGDATTTVKSDIDLTGTINGDGHANSFASVDLTDPGPWSNVLNGNWFFVDTNGNGIFGQTGITPTETPDLRFGNTFTLQPAWNGATGIKGFQSNDPARVYTAVPEPGTLVLLGLGLLGLGFCRRRK